MSNRPFGLQLALALAVIASPGLSFAQDDCSNLVPGDYDCQISFDGDLRTFEVHVPASVTPATPVPLVIDMHAFTNDSGQQRAMSGWEAKSDVEGFIVSWPQGIGNAWDSQGQCCVFFGNRDDTGFIETVVSEISAAANIDPDRVYATGLSNGGSQSHTMACESADIFAAIAPVSYTLSGGNSMAQIIANCNPVQGIPVIHFHGTIDDTVSYENGTLDALGAQDSLEAWSIIQSCDPTITTENVSSNVVCETHSNCIDDAEVTLCTVDQGNHFLYSFVQGTTIPDEAWAFFEAHAMPEPGATPGLFAGALALAALGRRRVCR